MRTPDRPLLAPLLVAVALLGGCTATVDPGEGAAGEPGGAAPAADPDSDAEVAADAPRGDADTPQVPPLHPDADHLDESVVTIATSSGAQVRVDVKVAVTDADRQRGLMEVTDLPAGAGMLFLFDGDRTGGFWMRNTLVPLDIAFTAADGTIGTILTMEPCAAVDAADCEVYRPEAPYRSALEVPAGWFATVGVAEGDALTWTPPAPAADAR